MKKRIEVSTYGVWALLCAVVLSIALAGCGHGLFGSRAKPDYLQVVAVGRADASDQTTSSSLPAILSCEAESPVQAEGADPALRTMEARAAARRQALGKLAAQLAPLPAADGLTFGQWLAAKPERKGQVEAALEQQAKVSYEDQAQRTVAKAQIEPPSLYESLGLPPNPAALDRPTPPPAKQQAYERAMAEARRKLREAVLAVDMGNERTLADAIASDPSRQKELDAWILMVQPIEVLHPEPGMCVVNMLFDRNVARKLGQSR